MILSPLSRQQTALPKCRPLIQTQCLCRPKTQRRRLHKVPQLVHNETFSKDGVPGMLSSDGFDLAWHQYQGHVVDRLNRLTAGTPLENSATKDIIVTHARQPQAASLFNHASMAWANHQFFSTLSPDPPKMSPLLTSKVNDSFSSPESLRDTFIATANAMFGPGFVWLVRHKHRNAYLMENELSILTTYLAGSPLPGAHYRRQEQDQNTMMAAGSFGSTSLFPGEESKLAYGGADIDILLGVNTWQHVWLMDWGIGGKKAYLEGWWKAINWDVVESNWQSIREQKSDFKKITPLSRLADIGRRRQQPVEGVQ
ncbi:Manganese/iron superoxide dismutase [Usnea florida]